MRKERSFTTPTGHEKKKRQCALYGSEKRQKFLT